MGAGVRIRGAAGRLVEQMGEFSKRQDLYCVGKGWFQQTETSFVFVEGVERLLSESSSLKGGKFSS